MQNHLGAMLKQGGLQPSGEKGYPMGKNTLAPNTDKIGTARLVGQFENGSPEWHELRRTGIGGSDIAAICNASPWTSPFALWAKKTGRIPDDYVPSEAAEWGTRLESVVLDKFEEQHPELFVTRDVGTWAHSERPWQLANPDAIAHDADTRTDYIIEVKTSRYEDDWADGVPAYYRTQVQWYLQTFGFSKAYVVALFAGSKYREFEIDADSFEQATNLEQVEMFRKYLDEDIQPDYDGALSTYETIRELHPNIDPESEVELGDLGVYYFLAVMEHEKSEAHLNEMKSRVLDAMGSAKRGMIDDEWKVTRQARNGGKPYLINKK